MCGYYIGSLQQKTVDVEWNIHALYMMHGYYTRSLCQKIVNDEQNIYALHAMPRYILGVSDKRQSMTSGISMLYLRCVGTIPGVSDKIQWMMCRITMLCIPYV